MEHLAVENFRCFRAKQGVRLAPLTLLMGENSTGKTSLLAIIRALHDLAFNSRVPDFKEAPYDLGSFEEVAHHRGARGGRAESFQGSIRSRASWYRDEPLETTYTATFRERSAAPFPVRRRIAAGETWIEVEERRDGSPRFRFGTERGIWTTESRIPMGRFASISPAERLPDGFVADAALVETGERDRDGRLVPEAGSPEVKPQDRQLLRRLASVLFWHGTERPFATAPVRSRPRRIYSPRRVVSNPEGDSVPMYLADLRLRDKDAWSRLRDALQRFGVEAGLFDEIAIKRLGKGGGAPFQVQVRKFSHGLKGPPRNLIDVGYGVSQVLPVLTELLERPHGMFLLQQPEVHLHPSAQAALGSLFCQMAGDGRQIIVETHSDHLMDRARMDVRDGRGNLKPEDVVILYFERWGLDVRIHEIGVDRNGNIRGNPDSYRRFFLKERTRSLGL